jgi:hypothetical protein
LILRHSETKKGKLLTQQTAAIVDITIRTHWSGRQIDYKLPCSTSVQGSTTKSQLRRNNGTDGQRIGCYTSGWSARVPGEQRAEIDTLGLVATRDFLKKRACYLRLVTENNKVGGLNVTSITVVVSIDPELLELWINPRRYLIDMKKIDAD